MKRILLFAVVLLSTIFLSGCSKDLKDLAGTVWEKTDSGVMTTITFTKIICEVKIASITDPDDYSSSYYSYEYKSSTVIMYPEDKTKATLKGIISDDIMSVVNMSNEKTIGIFIKRK